jgi:NADH-quinone oxidoreductase subunit M
VGEFLVILASFKANPWIAFLAATTLILGAAYTLWMVKRVMFGAVPSEKMSSVGTLEDLSYREIFILSVLAIAVLFFGLYPAPLLEVMHASVDHLLQHIAQTKL